MQKSNIPRNELLSWLNNLLKTSIQNYKQTKRIQDLGNGVAYIMIMSILYPQAVNLRKVNVNAKLEHQNLSNLKLLTSFFYKLNISKVIEMEKIAKMKYQNNLELLQWIHLHYQQNKYKIKNIKPNATIQTEPLNNNKIPNKNKKVVLVKQPSKEQMKLKILGNSKINQHHFTKKDEENFQLQIKTITQKMSQHNIIEQISHIVEDESTDSMKLKKIKNILFKGKSEVVNPKSINKNNNPQNTQYLQIQDKKSQGKNMLIENPPSFSKQNPFNLQHIHGQLDDKQNQTLLENGSIMHSQMNLYPTLQNQQFKQQNLINNTENYNSRGPYKTSFKKRQQVYEASKFPKSIQCDVVKYSIHSKFAPINRDDLFSSAGKSSNLLNNSCHRENKQESQQMLLSSIKKQDSLL